VSLDLVWRLAAKLASPSESIGVVTATQGRYYGLIVSVGSERVSVVTDARSLDEAITRTIAELQDAVDNIENLQATLSFVQATSWGST
jgi:hypothetical protein